MNEIENIRTPYIFLCTHQSPNKELKKKKEHIYKKQGEQSKIGEELKKKPKQIMKTREQRKVGLEDGHLGSAVKTTGKFARSKAKNGFDLLMNGLVDMEVRKNHNISVIIRCIMTLDGTIPVIRKNTCQSIVIFL